MAVKKAGLSQELHPKDVRKSSHRAISLQHTKWFPHLYKAYSGIYEPADFVGDLNDMHHKAHSGQSPQALEGEPIAVSLRTYGNP